MDEVNVALKIGSPQQSVVKEEELKINVHSSIRYEEAHQMGDELESTRTEVKKVTEENQRLKTMLKQIENEYQSLKRRYFETTQQESNKKSKESNNSSSISSSPTSTTHEENKEVEDDHDELVSLSLGRKNSVISDELETRKENEKIPSEDAKKNTESDEVLQKHLVKRARVSVRARCDSPTMNDGCQWRKYGQKISKGNPCPRAYYRCTVALACPVRKQVQRCAQDMSILITTYEGTHNHPLPISATAMASTTSAAASMLLSGSSTTTATQNPNNTSPISTHDHHNNLSRLMNFNQFDNSKQTQFYVPNTSSTSPAFPTITLDLSTNQSSSWPLNLYDRLSSTTSLNFSSSQSNNNILPTFWNNNKTQFAPSFQLTTHSQNDHNNVNYFQSLQDPPQHMLTETLTKAITSDPSFRTVIAAAISSMATRGGGGGGGSKESSKWGDQISMANSFSIPRGNANGATQSSASDKVDID